MKALYALLADHVNETRDGKLNLLGIFNSVRATQLPATAQMHLVIVFQTDPPDRGQTKSVEIRLLDADGQELLRLGQSMAIPADAPLSGDINLIVRLAQLRFDHFGRYAFYVTVNGEQKADVPFSLDQVPPSQPPAP